MKNKKMGTTQGIVLAGAIAVMAGCQPSTLPNELVVHPAEVPLRVWQADTESRNGSDGVLVAVSLSGGGMRASALGQGVIEALRVTRKHDATRTMLREVDIVAGVSGGAIPAAYLAINGEENRRGIRESWTKVDVTGEMIKRALHPRNLMRVASEEVTRTTIWKEYLQEQLLGTITYAELDEMREQGEWLPRLIVGTSDISETRVFNFTERDFNALCADLRSIEVAKAVAASTAIPVLLPPVRIVGAPGLCERNREEENEAQIKNLIGNAVKELKEESARNEENQSRLRYEIAVEELKIAERRKRLGQVRGQLQKESEGKATGEEMKIWAENRVKELKTAIEDLERERIRTIQALEDQDTAIRRAAEWLVEVEETRRSALKALQEAEKSLEMTTAEREKEAAQETVWERWFGGETELEKRMKNIIRIVGENREALDSQDRAVAEALREVKESKTKRRRGHKTIERLESRLEEERERWASAREDRSFWVSAINRRVKARGRLTEEVRKLQHQIRKGSRIIEQLETQVHGNDSRETTIRREMSELEGLQKARALREQRKRGIHAQNDRHAVEARHLMDGGLLDNSGLSGILEVLDFVLDAQGVSELPTYRALLPNRALLVVVDAGQGDIESRWKEWARPNTWEVLRGTIRTGLRARADMRVDQAKEIAAELTKAGIRTIVSIIDETDLSANDECRTWFQEIETNWTLSSEAEGKLIRIGRALLLRDPGYRRFAREEGFVVPPVEALSKFCERGALNETKEKRTLKEG